LAALISVTFQAAKRPGESVREDRPGAPAISRCSRKKTRKTNWSLLLLSLKDHLAFRMKWSCPGVWKKPGSGKNSSVA